VTIVRRKAPSEYPRRWTSERPRVQQNLLIVSTVVSIPFIDNERDRDVSSDCVGEGIDHFLDDALAVVTGSDPVTDYQ
jgi:hypothetical protein